jgi:hypothetical protein
LILLRFAAIVVVVVKVSVVAVVDV